MSDNKANEYFEKAKQWRDELNALRKVVLECGLTEEFKWRVPCYTSEEKNIVVVSSMKEACVLSFFKGALLPDPEGVLIQPGENTQSGRVIRFRNKKEIISMKPLIKQYVKAAVEIEKSGAKVDFKTTGEYPAPEEWEQALAQMPEVKTAFEKLTPGRQRAYLLHFSGAKQADTRQARIEKYIPRILDGKGFHDCVCGHSKKMPLCDGSHKKYPS